MSEPAKGIEAERIVVDWGTSNMRAWACSASGEILARGTSSMGMSGVNPDQFEAVLLDVIADWLPDHPTPVIACGMVGARQGWVEAPYLAVPCIPPGLADAVRPVVGDPRLRVSILPGVMQRVPADVMRGEETQIAGFLVGSPGFDGTVCLPGTHTKWVTISGGRIEGFRTFMTGEIFALLAERSILRHSTGSSSAWNMETFESGLSQAVKDPADLAANLFQIRAGGLIGEADSDFARSRLSGLLIGQELIAAKPLWQKNGAVVMIGEDKLARLYREGLNMLGQPSMLEDAEPLTLKGLAAACADPGESKR